MATTPYSYERPVLKRRRDDDVDGEGYVDEDGYAIPTVPVSKRPRLVAPGQTPYSVAPPTPYSRVGRDDQIAMSVTSTHVMKSISKTGVRPVYPFAQARVDHTIHLFVEIFSHSYVFIGCCFEDEKAPALARDYKVCKIKAQSSCYS